jgi:hypothetical protein
MLKQKSNRFKEHFRDFLILTQKRRGNRFIKQVSDQDSLNSDPDPDTLMNPDPFPKQDFFMTP